MRRFRAEFQKRVRTGEHESCWAGRIFAHMQYAGMHTMTLAEIVRQNDPALKRVGEAVAGLER